MPKKLDKISRHRNQSDQLDNYIKYGMCDNCGRESYNLLYIDTNTSLQIVLCRRCHTNNNPPKGT